MAFRTQSQRGIRRIKPKRQQPGEYHPYAGARQKAWRKGMHEAFTVKLKGGDCVQRGQSKQIFYALLYYPHQSLYNIYSFAAFHRTIKVDSDFAIQDNQPAMSFFITALGLMMIFEGIPYFCFPKQVKEFAQKLPGIENGVLRIIGLAIMLLGLVAVYWGKSMADIG